MAPPVATVTERFGTVREWVATVTEWIATSRQCVESVATTVATLRATVAKHAATVPTLRRTVAKHATTVPTSRGTIAKHAATVPTLRPTVAKHAATIGTDRATLATRRVRMTEGDWDEAELLRIGGRVTSWIAEHLARMPERPVFQPYPTALAEELATADWPEDGASPDAILDDFTRTVGPWPFGNGHPRFFGWVNSPPEPMGVFADALAAAMNPSCAGGNHAAIHLERQVVRWLAAMLGMPASSMGLLVSGGSMAALTALAVARHARAGFDVREEGLAGAPRMRVYRSSEGHGCYQKAVELLGLGRKSLHAVDVDDALRMVPEALDRAIACDRARGEVPLAVVASAGTVNTGAIDPLDAIADVCAKHGVWLHVDGAYGAPAILAPEHAEALAPMARADSVAMDPHKWLYVPVECGLVVVRDAAAMRDAFTLVPPYLRTSTEPAGVSAGPWLAEYGFQQTRGFRALKAWMALKRRGRAGYRAAIAHDLATARHLAAVLRAAPDDFEVWEPQGLGVVCFRWAPKSLRASPDEVDAKNRAIATRVQLGGRAFLSTTVLRGRFWLRACVVNPRAEREDVEALVAAVRAAATE